MVFSHFLFFITFFILIFCVPYLSCCIFLHFFVSSFLLCFPVFLSSFFLPFLLFCMSRFFSFIHSFFLSLFSTKHYRARRLRQLFFRCPGLNSIGTRSILTNMLWFSSDPPGRCLIGIVNRVAATPAAFFPIHRRLLI